MKTFNEIHEGILNNIDDTIKNADKVTKQMKDIADIRKFAYLLGDLYNNLYKAKSNNCDNNGVKIEFGDIVMFADPYAPTSNHSVFLYGVVLQINNNTCEIGVKSNYGKPTESAPFGDFLTYDDIPARDIVVLCRKNNAERLLKILVKIL